MDEPADVDLIDSIQRRDVAALGRLYDRYGQYAYNLAARVVGEQPLAEDVVQEVFLNLWRQAAQFDAGRGSVRAWLLSSVRNRAVDLVRRRAGKTRLEVQLDAADHLLASDDLWQQVATNLDRDLLRCAMAELSVEQREALDLAYFQGMSQSEIAKATRTPLGTVKGRLRLGLERMRVILEANGVRAMP